MIKFFVFAMSLLAFGGMLSQPANSRKYTLLVAMYSYDAYDVVKKIYYFAESAVSPITVVGNEHPLINGLRRDLTCVFNGQNNATTIRWVVVLGSLMPLHSQASNTNELVLNLDSHPDLNGLQLKCVVIDTLGVTYEETISITVEGNC